MFGIDCASLDENTIDWPTLRARGKTFAYVRATFGSKPDGDFPRFWSGMRAAGILRGAYHFLRHDQGAREQALRFLDAVRLRRGDLPPALDVEVVDGLPPKPIVEAVRAWIAIVEEEMARRHGHPIRVMICTSERVWRLLGDPAGLEANPLWIVDWARFDAPRTPALWGERQWVIHQYAGDTRGIPGISRQADLDRFNLFKAGDRGRCVVAIKELLRQAGFGENLGDDDRFDEHVRSAVLRFQATRRLVADGMVGPKTYSELHWPGEGIVERRARGTTLDATS